MKNKEYYTVNVAYTTPSGRMHAGHGLGHVISDVALRYGALKQGKKTFFGFGMHSTGKDIIKIIEQLQEERGIKETLEKYNISDSKRQEILSSRDLETSIKCLVEEYRLQYKEVLERLGIKMNFDTFFSTNQEANQRYTQWTLKQLNKQGLIVETEANRPYCPECQDIKHIDKDLSEVSATSEVEWDKLRVEKNGIVGGDFECRAHPGVKIIVKNRKEKAIAYSDELTQEKTIELKEDMVVFPKKYKSKLDEIIRSRKEKPFERKARGNIGASSPFSTDKKVEALSDSNTYMEFYALSKFINQRKIKPHHLTEEFFDYIYLKKGGLENVSKKTGLDKHLIKEIKKFIEDVYPVDVSVVGFEHIGVHTPFSLFTHAAALPKDYFFLEYVITSHITHNGEKMSKSKGNVIYLDNLLEYSKNNFNISSLSEQASFDLVRFFLSYYQNLDKDFDWSDDNFKNIGMKGLKRYVRSILDTKDLLELPKKEELSLFDKWFLTLDRKTTKEITEKMDERDTRGALITLIDLRGKALSHYTSQKNKDDLNPEILSSFLRHQIDMGFPVVPRIAEELKENIFNEIISEWPMLYGTELFLEEYEEVEHMVKGKNYEKQLIGEIKATLGKMQGRKEIKSGQTVTVKVPTKYQKRLLGSQKNPLFKNINIELLVDLTIDSMEITKSY